jgi:HPt (histidine-containing phosphotransfer) domain-containing protein
MLKKWQPMPDTLPAVDVSALEALVGSDVEILRSFLNDFGRSSQHIATELRTACAAENAAQVGALAHKLKSSARSVGALPLGELCSALETAGKGAALESLGLLLPEFDKELARVNQFIAHWDNEHAH